jgi:2-haloacid dehalogenase
LTQRALDYCFERFPSVDRRLRASLLDAYLKLDAYPDALQVLRALKARGERTAILTNGSPAMVGAAVEAAGLKAELDTVLSVDTVKMFKPRPEVYALVTREFSCQPADVTFVSSNRWDAFGASAFGFRTVWINRAQAPDEYPDFPPAAVVSDLVGLLS